MTPEVLDARSTGETQVKLIIYFRAKLSHCQPLFPTRYRLVQRGIDVTAILVQVLRQACRASELLDIAGIPQHSRTRGESRISPAILSMITGAIH